MASIGTELRVGIFVVTALIIATVLVFLVGSETNVFVSRSEYRAVFQSVGGLRPGGPVRVAGVTVGSVQKVELLESGEIGVVFNVRDNARHLMREDSTATISSKGLLGDMLVEVTVGAGQALEPGSLVRTTEAAGIQDYMERAGRLLDEVETTARNLAVASGPLADEEFGRDVQDITHNLARLSDMFVNGKGPLQHLLTNERMATNLEHTLENAHRAIGALEATAHDVQALTKEVRQGDGLAHALLYDKRGGQLLASLAGAGEEISSILHDVRTNESAVHNLLYKDETGQLVANLTALSADLRAITATVKDGQGTLGGLLVDPSLYEDMKRLVGDLERNRILRSLVRYSIRESSRDANRSVQPAADP